MRAPIDSYQSLHLTGSTVPDGYRWVARIYYYAGSVSIIVVVYPCHEPGKMQESLEGCEHVVTSQRAICGRHMSNASTVSTYSIDDPVATDEISKEMILIL
jgi:hypothetical protein